MSLVQTYRDTSNEPTPSEVIEASRVASTLDSQFPGYHWQVANRHGLLIIRNRYLDPEFGYVINKAQMNGTIEQEATRAATEILERNNIRTGTYDNDGYLDAIDRAANGKFITRN